MTNGSLDDQYLEWIYKEIGAVRNRNPARSYWRLAKLLYTTPFTYFVGNDENRAMDGCELRIEFLEEKHIDQDEAAPWLALECSVLEMLVGLARRAAFESYGQTGDWFRLFIRNLEFLGYTDAVWSTAVERTVNERVDELIHRKYQRNGLGGLFPLRRPGMDQRKVELWYQLSAYLLEGDYMDHGPQV